MRLIAKTAVAIVITGMVGTGAAAGICYWVTQENAQPRVGTVINRSHREGYMECYGKPIVCNWIPDSWELCLRADPGDTTHHPTGCIDVTSGHYQDYHIGDHFPNKTSG